MGRTPAPNPSSAITSAVNDGKIQATPALWELSACPRQKEMLSCLSTQSHTGQNHQGMQAGYPMSLCPLLGQEEGWWALPRGEEDSGQSCSLQQEHPVDAMPVRLFAILGCGSLFLARNSTLDLKSPKKPLFCRQHLFLPNRHFLQQSPSLAKGSTSVSLLPLPKFFSIIAHECFRHRKPFVWEPPWAGVGLGGSSQGLGRPQPEGPDPRSPGVHPKHTHRASLTRCHGSRGGRGSGLSRSGTGH